MNTTLIIFTLGTAASFVPLYWLAMRFARRWSRPAVARAPRRAEQPGRREFLDLLRREAATRAVAVLHEALVEVRLAADRGSVALSMEMRRSLADTGRLIDSLFVGELRERFRQGAEALAVASPSTLGEASIAGASAIAAFERAIDAEAERATRREPHPAQEGLSRKALNLIGIGAARAAA